MTISIEHIFMQSQKYRIDTYISQELCKRLCGLPALGCISVGAYRRESKTSGKQLQNAALGCVAFFVDP